MLIHTLRNSRNGLGEGLQVRVHRKLKRELLKKVLAREENACYVLITCGEPSEDGRMEVEFTYEGDASLASYLLESAQSYLEDKI